MKTDIQGFGFNITPALADHVQRRLQFALARHRLNVQHVSVRVGDQNGPRGGVDKFCRIHVQLPELPLVVVEEVHVDMYAAVGRAVERAGRAVAKNLQRSQVTRSSPPPRQADHQPSRA